MKMLRSVTAILFSTLALTTTASYAQTVPPAPSRLAFGVWNEGGGRTDAATGAAVTSYPFALPRARGFVQPTLGLHYRSTNGPSEVGEGWSIGLPAITRRNAAGGPPRYDGTDHFELSGQRLVRCNGACDGRAFPPWASGWTQYRGNVEHGRTVVYYDNANTFRMQLADGGFAEFGKALVAAVAGDEWSALDVRAAQTTAEIYRWKLVRLVDVGVNQAWNNVTVFRWHHQGPRDVSVLTDIYFTPSPAAGLTNFDRYALGNHPSLAAETPRPVSAGTRTEPSTSNDDLLVSIGDRKWRVRGLGKNAAPATMRVNVLVSREGGGFHVDALELYSARQRAHYITTAAAELGVEERVIKKDLGELLLKLEELHEKQTKNEESTTKKPTLSDAEQRRGDGQERRVPSLPPHMRDADARGRRRHPLHPRRCSGTSSCRRRRTTPGSRSDA